MQFISRSRLRIAIFTKLDPMQYSLTHCLQSSLRKRYACKLENSFIKEKAKDHVLRSKQIRNVNHKIYQVKKQDHLGKRKAKCEASRRLDATSWTTESQTYLCQRFKSRMNKNDKQSPRRTISSRYEPDAEDQQVQ